ncbi:MAG: DUF488 domain-containing protein [Acidobacteria bacterium]|nr:DUF488 domain-containing protein [Acidobacteriota bacterium]
MGVGQAEVHTLGFSNREWAGTLEILRAYRIERLIDIRTVPKSRHTPQYNSDQLAWLLPELGIEYYHLKALGGFRKPKQDDPTNAGWRNESFRGFADYMQTQEYAEALAHLITLFKERRSVYACTEAVFWRCHRSLVSDALLIRGHEVGHIFSATKCDPHRLTSFARVEGARVTYPGPPGD